MIGAFQRNAFQDNAFQINIPTPAVVTTTRGGIYWKPEKDYEWPDLPGDVLAAVHAAVRELAGGDSGIGHEAPSVATVVAVVQPQEFAMGPEIDMADLAQKIRTAAAMAIAQWLEEDDEEAMLVLIH